MSEERIYLVELTGYSEKATAIDIQNVLQMAIGKIPQNLAYDADGDGRVTIKDVVAFMKNQATVPVYPTTFYYATSGYMSRDTDTPAKQYYEPRIVDPGLFRQSMFSLGSTGGKSEAGRGNIILTNIDGALEALIDYGFGDHTCVVKTGYPSQPLSEFTTLIYGTVEQVEFTWSQTILRLKDNAVLFDTPVQMFKYTGGGGLEGGADLQDKPKPRLFGNCRNITPVLVDAESKIYQVSDGAVYSIPNMYDSGKAYNVGALYTSQADMEANSPLQGEFRAWPAGGYFRVGNTPPGAVTCDVIQGATTASRYAGQIIKQLAGEKCGPANIVVQSITDLDVAAPYEVGLYISSDMSTAAALDDICASVSAWWSFDNEGKFWCKQLGPPDATQSLSIITDAEILSVDRVATSDGDRGVPIYKVNVEYDKNWTVQTSGLTGYVTDIVTFGGLDVPLSTARQLELKTEYKRVTVYDGEVKSLHLNSPEITIKTLLKNKADAEIIANHCLTMRSTRRDRLRIELQDEAVRYPTEGYWDNEAVSEMPTARRGHASVVFGNYLYVIGGDMGAGASKSVIRLDLTNPSGAWDDAGVPDLPTGRYQLAAVVYGNYVYVVGGFTSAASSVIRLNLASPTLATDAWDDVGVTDLPTQGRQGHSAVVYGNFLFVIGGFNLGYLSSVIMLNLSSPGGSWSDTATDLSSGRAYSSAVVYGDYIYLIGGRIAGTITSSVVRLHALFPASAWDDVGVADLPSPRNLPAATILDRYIYVTGGDNGSYLSSAIRLDLTDPTGAWDDAGAANLPSARSGHSLITAGTRVYLTGGNTTTPFKSAWRYRTNYSPSDAPQLTSLGRTILIKHPRYGYEFGRPMRIIGKESNYRDGKITLELWG